MCWLKAIEDKVVKRSFRYISRTLISSVIRLIAFIQNIPVRRQSIFYPPNGLEIITEPHTEENGLGNDRDPNSQSYVHEKDVTEDDRVLPCVQRLQKLESLLEELNSKPAQIPMDKDRILQQSLDRIKSVESDLEKTKRVLHAAVLKQLQIAELLENMRESKFQRRRFFC